MTLSQETEKLTSNVKPSTGKFVIYIGPGGRIRIDMPTEECLKVVRQLGDVTVENCLCG